LKKGTILINTSRGAVTDNQAVKKHLESGHLAAAILDVWEGEPSPDCELLKKVFIGSPHIAGYSFDGKARGTSMIYNAACRHFRIHPTWTPKGLLPEPENPTIVPDKSLSDSEDILRDIVRKAYSIRNDDRDMRKLLELAESERAACFDSLRKNYPVRREFEAFRVDTRELNGKLAGTIHALGFERI
jgi:erythronate-4-phosphate dehydrogenase